MQRLKSWTGLDLASSPPRPEQISGMKPVSGLNPSSHQSPESNVPSMPHPHPYERIAIVASDHGLLMRPHTPGLHHPESYVCVSWSKAPMVSEVPSSNQGPQVDWMSAATIYGIVGMLELFNASYLLVVTARADVGCVFDESRAIYGVKRVSAIPLQKDRARRVIAGIVKCGGPVDKPPPSIHDPSKDIGTAPEEPSDGLHITLAEAAGDIKATVPIYGPTTSELIQQKRDPTPVPCGATTPNFIESSSPIAALSKRISSQLRNLRGPKEESSFKGPESIIESIQREFPTAVGATLASNPSQTTEEHHSEFEDRIVRECVREYTKGCMFFAYDFDLTRSLQRKHELYLKTREQDKVLVELDALPQDCAADPLNPRLDPLMEPSLTLPLWRRVDRQYWWNEWLSKPFVDAGLHPYVLPMVQGHFQVAKLDLAASSHDVDYVIASRRSRYRAGLRYQRRGIDDEAHVANFVETEAIVRIRRDENCNVFSFVQIRGSVPLFWTQFGYSMKPPPVLVPERTTEQNRDAMKRHFRSTIPIYGHHTVVNLVEQRGKESTLGNAYKAYVNRIADDDISYEEYDFHHETRGMKYERLSNLISHLERTFESQGFFWVSDNAVLSKQRGVFRVNCIDCLDRTNVVQSAFARHVLGVKLVVVGISVPMQGQPEVDVIFNDVWANNGDTISRAYAGTSALKGDFTRTGKRDLGGLFNDGVNSLTRMYSATFSDWFSQAVIDFMLGYRTLSVFSEFLLKLQSTDPRELIRLSRVRAEAIATSVSRILEEGETLLSGWTVFSPEPLNVRSSDRFEEKVLLLSVRALYIVSYDYVLEKVKLYIRVPLGMIIKITKGAYIISPLEEASRDPIQNAGFTVSWLNTSQISTRTGSCSYPNSPTMPPSSSSFDISKRPISAAGNKPVMSNHRLHARSHSSISSFFVGESPASVLNLTPPSPSSALGDIAFAAFKVLPVDPARVRSGSAAGYAEPADDLAGATTCKEVVDLMVNAVRQACHNAMNGRGPRDDFVIVQEEDVMSLADARRTTSIYAKMEYGVKRLLWLGG